MVGVRPAGLASLPRVHSSAVDVSLRRALAEALGADAVLHSGAMLAPADADGVGRALRLAGEHGLALRLSSGTGAGAPAPEGGAVLSLSRLSAIAVDASRAVARAEAGASLERLREALAAAGVSVPGLPDHPRSVHVGSLIARGELPRRSVTGIGAVLPGGHAVLLGSAVLKDVVGYDLVSVLLGSAGRLAAVVAVHLRLSPAGAAPPTAEPAGVRPVGALAEAWDPRGVLAGS
jgi:glycolate oxidase